MAIGRVVILGNGGHARACLDAWDPSPELAPAGYVGPAPGDVLGLEYLGDDDALGALTASGLRLAFVALGSNTVRAEVTARCLAAGLTLVTVLAPSAQVGRTARVGAGSIVLHGAMLGAKVVVGRGSIINTAASMDHDCIIGDFVHIAPGARLAGGIVIGDGAMVGIGASLVPGVRIGARALVGAGAVVLHDVPEGRTVVGNPAEELVR
jgi:UDP-perosamine 4-acetyltransferase